MSLRENNAANGPDQSEPMPVTVTFHKADV